MRKKPLLTMLSTAVLTAAASLSVPMTSAIAAPAAKSNQPSKFTNNVYVVRLAEQPVSAYDGSIKGLQATRPRKGQKIDPNSPAVINYRAFLESRQDAVLGSVGGGKKLYSYGYVFNGFAAELTAEQAVRLSATAGVLSVTKDTLMQPNTSSTPTFLGLTDQNGLWNDLGGVGSAGENIVIGVVDSGIWPEHPSYSDRTGANGNYTKDGKLGYQQIPGWNGKCQPGEAFNASNCNQKLIGARYYNAGWGGNAAIDAFWPFEFNSPRDWGGHGTHTSTTAGGNNGVEATGPAEVFGTISGIAPRARISAYKVCWADEPNGGGCWPSDSVAAIDQAVADGVDVINFSISGTRTNFLDPVEVAFLFAADAGVFVAASAGNSGTTIGASSVAHPSPWITTVAASTHNRNGEGSTTLGNNVKYVGASLATELPSTPVINALAAGKPGADPVALALCYSSLDGENQFDPVKVKGKVVVCDRGVTARVNKSYAVAEAGGVGMLLVNTSVSSLNADFHYVPTVHLQSTDRAAVQAYAATDGATASIAQAKIVYNVPAPQWATFSSYGPLLAGGGDLLKPDVIGPGQDILAGVAPPANGNQLFNIYSGTSMSSPHVAGLAALLKNKHPSWSPMAIKSALMTTAGNILGGSSTNTAIIFRQGAGQVRPNLAANPGLVFDSNANDWLAFLCGTTTGVTTATCNALKAAGYSTDPSNLNVASIAIGDLLAPQVVTRKVTNVGSGSTKYDLSLIGLAGYTVEFPPSITVQPGKTASFDVRVTKGAAAYGTYAGGQLTLSNGTHTVRIPIVVRPVSLIAPAAVAGTGDSISYNVTFGYSGPFSATARGLVAATVTPGTVSDDPSNGDCSLTAQNAVLTSVEVPAGTTYARFALFDADVVPGSDIDLCVFKGDTAVGSSATGTSAETVNLANPAPGSYTVVVHGWGVDGSSPFKLHTWLVPDAPTGNMLVNAPVTAVPSTSSPIKLTFDGLESGKKYLGSVAYAGESGMPNPTIVSVNKP